MCESTYSNGSAVLFPMLIKRLCNKRINNIAPLINDNFGYFPFYWVELPGSNYLVFTGFLLLLLQFPSWKFYFYPSSTWIDTDEVRDAFVFVLFFFLSNYILMKSSFISINVHFILWNAIEIKIQNWNRIVRRESCCRSSGQCIFSLFFFIRNLSQSSEIIVDEGWVAALNVYILIRRPLYFLLYAWVCVWMWIFIFS